MIRKVGFVGLGNMGGPMAANLVKAGFEVAVFDLVAELMARVEGAVTAASALEAARDADVFVSMLPAGRHVSALYLEGGVLEAMRPDALLIDCSTIDPATARAVAARAAESGVAMLDAPVSGGIAGAANASLTFIVGGPAPAVERARPIFAAMGANVFHAGDNGAGQVAKICNNMLLAIQMACTAEALALGTRNGLDPAVLSEIMKKSSVGNWTLNVYNPYPGVMEGSAASRGYQGGFLVDLMIKDLGLAMATASGSGGMVPLGALAENLYRLHRETFGAGGLDFSSIQWLFRQDLRGDSDRRPDR
jgi:3-hydroxyisobutyrate dehydrogenase